MKRLFDSLFRHHTRKDEQTIEDLPWLSAPSICLFIRKHIDPVSGCLKPEGEILPDEKRRSLDSKMRWAAGALDGVFGHHAGTNHDPIVAHKIAYLVAQIAVNDSDIAKIGLYKLLLNDDLLAYIDLAIKEILKLKVEPYPKLYHFAAFLIRESPDRGPVKFGIALLGIMRAESEVDTIVTLACHEEFTLYAAVALSNILKNPEPQLWKMAEKVKGWGRIHLVERLSKTNDPNIKNWLLRDGFRNNIMTEYLAYSCAVGGNLRSALDLSEVVDDILLQSAGEILEALINGGPAEDIEDYDDAPYVLPSYLRHLESRAKRLEHFLAVQSIYRYLVESLGDPIERNEKGWSEMQYEDALTISNRILNAPDWFARVHEGLASNEDSVFYLADRVAHILDISVWGKHWERLLASPISSQLWYYVMRGITLDQANRAVQLALEVFPLDEVATGPSEDISFGLQYPIHACLDRILQGLGEFPGMGWPLVATSLKSPFIHNRNLAVKVMTSWGRLNWTNEMIRALYEAFSNEPVERVKEQILQALNGEVLD